MKKLLIIASVLALIAFGVRFANEYSRSRDTQLFGNLVNSIKTEAQVIALTFDDGPTARNTGVLLRLLDEGNVKATFFLNGQNVTVHPDETRAIFLAGHEIGNHSWNHPRMVLMTPRKVRAQLDSTDAALRAVGYEGPFHFRPPFGRKLFVLPWVLDQQERLTVMWTIEPETSLGFDADPQALALHVIESAKPGDIVLLHGMFSSNQSTRDALPLIIDGLRSRGFEFVTVSDLISLGATP